MLVNDPGANHPGVSVPTREPERPRRSLLRAAPWIGLFVTGIGLFQVGWAAKDLLASGSSLDPRTSLELGLLLDQGGLASLSGTALAIAGFSVDRRGGRAQTPNPPAGSIADKGWHRSLLAIAVLLTLGVVVLSALPTPSNAIAYAPRDFDPLPPPTNLTTYGGYFVARPRLGFWGDRGSVVNVDVQVTWTDNRTGAVLFGGAPGNFTAYVASASSPRESPSIASTFVAPASRFYVLIVWVGRCPTPTSGACANTTMALQAQSHTRVPTIYLPAQVGGSTFGAALVIAATAGSRARSQGARP